MNGFVFFFIWYCSRLIVPLNKVGCTQENANIFAFSIRLHYLCTHERETLECKLLEGDDRKLYAVLCLLSADTTAATLSERTVPCHERRHWHRAFGLYGDGIAFKTVQRLPGGFVQPQEGADVVFLPVLHLLRRLSGSLHAATVYHCENTPRCSLRQRDGGQFHDGHRCVAFVAPQ